MLSLFRTPQLPMTSYRKKGNSMDHPQKNRPAWLSRLLDGRTGAGVEDDVLIVTVACDGLSAVDRAEGPDAADHIRRIMVRLLHESDENAVVDVSGDEFTLMTPSEDFDPNLWAIRMENSFRRAINDAGYSVAVAFQLGGTEIDALQSLPEPRYLN